MVLKGRNGCYVPSDRITYSKVLEGSCSLASQLTRAGARSSKMSQIFPETRGRGLQEKWAPSSAWPGSASVRSCWPAVLATREILCRVTLECNQVSPYHHDGTAQCRGVSGCWRIGLCRSASSHGCTGYVDWLMARDNYWPGRSLLCRLDQSASRCPWECFRA